MSKLSSFLLSIIKHIFQNDYTQTKSNQIFDFKTVIEKQELQNEMLYF